MRSGAGSAGHTKRGTARTDFVPLVDTAELPPLNTVDDLADLPAAPVSPAPAGPAAATSMPVSSVPVGPAAAGPRERPRPGPRSSRPAGHVTAGQINGSYLSAGQVNAGHVSAGQVNAGHVSAGQVNAGHVSAGHVNAGHVNAGHVSAGQVNAGHVNAGPGTPPGTGTPTKIGGADTRPDRTPTARPAGWSTDVPAEGWSAPGARAPEWSMNLPASPGITAAPNGSAGRTGSAAATPPAAPTMPTLPGVGDGRAGGTRPATVMPEWSMDLPVADWTTRTGSVAPVSPAVGGPTGATHPTTLVPEWSMDLPGEGWNAPGSRRPRWSDFEPATEPAGPLTEPVEVRSHRAIAGRARWERRYLLALLGADLLVTLAACMVAFNVRFGDMLAAHNRGYAVLSALLPLGFLGTLAANRGYERRYLYVGTDEYQRVLRAGLTFTAALAIVLYALDIHLARGYVSTALPVAVVGCVVGRFLLRKRLHRARERGACLRRVIVVGHELAVVGLTRQLKRERYHGMKVVGACLPPAGPGHDGQVGLPVYGTFDDVAGAVTTARADTVIVLSCPELDGYRMRRLAWQLERDDIDLIVASSLMDVAGDRTTIRPVDGLPMLHVEHPTLSGARRLVKAAFDRVGALVLLLLAAPVLLVLAVAIRLDSPGPVFFRQVRVGKDGREFLIFKFRTMYTDAERRLSEIRHLNEHDGVLFKMRDDPRVTKIGRCLRRLSLDELPQLINVLGGSMSLVGPRPPLPQEVATYPEDMCRRLAVPPGMTGLWQVSGRSDLPWEEAVRLDLRYVENWSLSLDLVILLRTLSAVVRSSGAY